MLDNNEALINNMLTKEFKSCSSRSTPKPRPPTPTTRPNITFQTYVCPEAYAKWYCLNGATCFSVRIGESILYNCECSDGYMGQRCEFKDLDGSYLPSREKILVETAGIAGGVTLVIVLFVVLSIAYYSYLRNYMRAQSPPLLGYSHLHESSAIDDVQQDKKIGINNYRNNLTRHYRSQPQYSTFKTGTGSYGSTVYSSPIATNITDHSLLHSPMRQCVACMSNCVPVPQSPHAQFHQGYQIKSTDYQVENNCVLSYDYHNFTATITIILMFLRGMFTDLNNLMFNV
ncbi:hypothetical protein BLOT_011349 [Blomia tropicalis]|nr:hypothetical protein BLOT_011349 [Blomia tropicalis]